MGRTDLAHQRALQRRGAVVTRSSRSCPGGAGAWPVLRWSAWAARLAARYRHAPCARPAVRFAWLQRAVERSAIVQQHLERIRLLHPALSLSVALSLREGRVISPILFRDRAAGGARHTAVTGRPDARRTRGEGPAQHGGAGDPRRVRAVRRGGGLPPLARVLRRARQTEASFSAPRAGRSQARMTLSAHLASRRRQEDGGVMPRAALVSRRVERAARAEAGAGSPAGSAPIRMAGSGFAAGASPAGHRPPDVEQLADHVMRQLDRRFEAYRERLGRI